MALPPELQRATALVPALKSNWLMMHVSVMMLSYATLLVGSLSVSYLVVGLASRLGHWRRGRWKSSTAWCPRMASAREIDPK